MSDLAFSNSSNLYHSFRIRSRILEEGKSCELRYAAEVDGRIFDIQLEVSDEMLKNQEKIKQAVINKALLASKLIPPTNRDLFTKVDSPGRIDKDILYFRAEALCTHESLDKIRKIFQIKLADQETQQDITALLEKLPCHEMTESEVVHCLEALQTIKDSFKRQQIIQKIDPSKINKSWFSVLPFAIRANEVDKNPDRIDLTAWEPILDWTVNGNSGFFEALKQGNLDINTKDRSENNLFIAAMKHIRKREYLEFAKKLLLIPGCKPVDFWILS